MAPDDRTSLGEFLLARYQNYAHNRSEGQEKWQEKIDAYRAEVHPESGAKTMKKGEGKGWRDQTRLAITRQKISSAFAIICDITLSGGQLPFCLKLDEAFQEEEDLFEDPLGQMTKTINSQVEATKAEREYFRCVLSAAIYGETWLKKVVKTIARKLRRELPLADPTLEGISGGAGGLAGGVSMGLRRFVPVIEETMTPSFEFVNPWNMYWDIEARDVENMEGMFHRVDCSPYELRRMLRERGTIKLAVGRALNEQEGTAGTSGKQDNSHDIEPRLREVRFRSRTIRRLEYWGRAPRRLVEEFETNVKGIPGTLLNNEQGDEVYITAVLAGDHVIKMRRVRPEENPFSRALFEEDLESPFGRSPADNLAPIQRILDGTVRAFIDNKKLASNLILFIKKRFIRGWTGSFEPGQVFELSEDCDDARKAVFMPTIPDIGTCLNDMINLFLQFADDESGIPRISQGLPSAGDMEATATEVNMRSERAQKYLGTAIRNLDIGLIEAGVGWMLEHNLENPPYAEYSGPFHVQATGFSSFQARVVRLAKLQQLLALVLQDEELRQLCKIDQMAAEIFKLSDIDPEQFLRSPEEVAMLQEQQMAQEQAMIEAEAAAGAPAADPMAEVNAQTAMADSETRAVAAEGQNQARLTEARAKANLYNAQADKARAEARAAAKGKKPEKKTPARSGGNKSRARELSHV